MTTRNQVKTRYSRFHNKASNWGDDEVIELNEPTVHKTKLSQRRKEVTETISSEATTPNKKNIKKRKDKSNEIEILDLSNLKGLKKTTTSVSSFKNKRTNSKVVVRDQSNTKKQAMNKSMGKSNVSNMRKNIGINVNKKEKKVASITLDESEKEENEDTEDEIQITSTENHPQKKNNKKNYPNKKIISKTPVRTHRRRKNVLTMPKKKKAVKRYAPPHKTNTVNQYDLSSSSSDEGGIEETQDLPRNISLKNNKKNNEKVNTGFFSSRKASQNQKNQKIIELSSPKAKSSVKIVKEKVPSFLGKKRKNEKNVKSRTPNKANIRRNKSPIEIVNKIPIEINSSPIKVRAGKSSRTPVKNMSKKLNNIASVNTGIKEYVTPELAVLNQLIVEFGFEKVLDSLCKAKLNTKNKLDSCIQGLRDSCSNEKLPLFLIKMMFNYFDAKYEEKDKDGEKEEEEKIVEKIAISDKDKEKDKEKDSKIKNKKSLSVLKSSSTENTNTINNEVNEVNEINEIPAEKTSNKSPIKSAVKNKNNNINTISNKINISEEPMVIEDLPGTSIHITEEEPIPVNVSSKKEKKIVPSVVPVSDKKKGEKNEKVQKSPIKIQNEEVKKEKKNMSIGSHYNKGDDGCVYKYQVNRLDGQGNAIFKCYDDRCSSEGIYDLDSRLFTVTKKHSLKHQDHDYISSYEKNEDNVFKEMLTLNKNDAQVFKEGNERTVKIY